MRINHYTVIVETKWSVTDEYKGTNLTDAINTFKNFDNGKNIIAVHFYINDELVKF